MYRNQIGDTYKRFQADNFSKIFDAMYFQKSNISKTTEVVDFCYPKFSYLGIELEIYLDKRKDKNPKSPRYALKRNDIHKRLSGLWQDGTRFRGDIRNDNGNKIPFLLEISGDSKMIRVIGLKEGFQLIGIDNPIQQNGLFTGHPSTSQGTSKVSIQDAIDIKLWIRGATGMERGYTSA